MKRLFFILIVLTLGISSCKKKCYECPQRPTGSSVCEGDPDYDMVDMVKRNGFNPTEVWMEGCSEK